MAKPSHNHPSLLPLRTICANLAPFLQSQESFFFFPIKEQKKGDNTDIREETPGNN